MRIDNITLSCLVSLVLLLASCGKGQSVGTYIEKLTTFPIPEPPVMLGVSPEARTQYVVSHYWDNYPFADTALIKNADVTEQGFADFLNLLPQVGQNIAEQALTSMMRGAEADTMMYRHFATLSESYLYDSNSPYRNDEYYIPILQQMLSSGLLKEIEKVRPRHQLKMLLKNRVGSRATDFAYTQPDGRTGRLYDISADYTLLFFNDPGCVECKHYKEYIATSELFGRWMSSAEAPARLKVLAFYPDREMDSWRKTIYPKEWIVGSNPSVSDNELYDIRAIPSLYLLDKHKKVLLRDATIDKVQHHLMQVFGEQK